MKRLDPFEHFHLERLRQRIVHPDHTAQTTRRLATDQGIQRDLLFFDAPHAQRLQQQIVCRLVGRLHQCADEPVVHLSCRLSDPRRGWLEYPASHGRNRRPDMLLPSQVLPFLQHREKPVRDLALRYLSNAHDPSPATAEDLWKLIDKFGAGETDGLFYALRMLPQTEVS